MTDRKSSGTKVVGVGAAEGPHGGLSLPSNCHLENVDALIPMIADHFMDAKVRQTSQPKLTL